MHHQRAIVVSNGSKTSRPRRRLTPVLLLPLAVAACNPATGGGGAGGNEDRQEGLPADTTRLALQSQCGQAVIECTSSWPIPIIVVQARDGQTVTRTQTGFLVQGTDGNGQESVQLIGSNSTATGNDVEAQILFSWSAAATDQDPCTLEPGAEFSTEADPLVLLQAGFHYVRLTVENDIIQETLILDGCDATVENVPSSDFQEVEIEVRD